MARPRKDACIRGHNLNDPDNVRVVTKKRRNGNGTYVTRECRPCGNTRLREARRAAA